MTCSLTQLVAAAAAAVAITLKFARQKHTLAGSLNPWLARLLCGFSESFLVLRASPHTNLDAAAALDANTPASASAATDGQTWLAGWLAS